MTRYLIADFFVDEPACFGVPPFVSPYPRYVFGALLDAGIPAESIDYKTIDSFRKNDLLINDDYSACFLIGGGVVPGRYLGQKIGTVPEIRAIAQKNPHLPFYIGGLAGILAVSHNTIINLHPILRDIESFAYSLSLGDPKDSHRDNNSIHRWAIAGAAVAEKIPDHPHIIAEIETYRGCPRQNHCSFCSEGLYGEINFRSIDSIIHEIDTLIEKGVSRFRIGRQADILAYGSRLDHFRNGFPRPDAGAVEELFDELHLRVQSGSIKTLNIDNGNPGTIVHFPDESRRALTAIARAVTPGDTLALGVESFDEAVYTANSLKVDRDGAIFAVRMINEIGSERVHGIHKLLPGINLIHGLAGESTETFRINYESLIQMRDSGLLIKRINIRTLNPFPGTPLADSASRIDKRIENRYEYYRNKIRSDIDHEMLTKIYPSGSVLKNLRTVESRDGYTLSRQIQSYAITVKTPTETTCGEYFDGCVLTHRERSIIALKIPIEINSLGIRELALIPGISRRAAGGIVLSKPISNEAALLQAAPDTDKNIVPFISYGIK